MASTSRRPLAWTSFQSARPSFLCQLSLRLPKDNAHGVRLPFTHPPRLRSSGSDLPKTKHGQAVLSRERNRNQKNVHRPRVWLNHPRTPPTMRQKGTGGVKGGGLGRKWWKSSSARDAVTRSTCPHCVAMWCHADLLTHRHFCSAEGARASRLRKKLLHGVFLRLLSMRRKPDVFASGVEAVC